MQMLSAIPALPVRSVEQSILFYRDVLELSLRHHDTAFAIFRRDTVEIHVWQADDERWRSRENQEPVISGAESFIAGTASCRIAVSGVDELYARLHQHGVIHPNGHLTTTEWGTREFGVTDPDNNLITFLKGYSKGTMCKHTPVSPVQIVALQKRKRCRPMHVSSSTIARTAVFFFGLRREIAVCSAPTAIHPALPSSRKTMRANTLSRNWGICAGEGGMNEADMTDLVAAIADRLYGTNEHACVALIRRLAAGQPVSTVHLATDLAIEAPAVAALLEQMSDLTYDDAGNIVGFGLSLVPTTHQFSVNGQSLYTWCALDTFLYTALLARPSQVISHCPATAQPIRLTMTPEGVTELTPASSVISLVVPEGSVADCRRSSFCNHGHFFTSSEASAAWLKDHSNGRVLSIADAHRLGRLLADRRSMLARFL